MSRLTKLVLHGELAEKYGTEFEFQLKTPGDLVNAMEANFPGFKRHILDLEAQGFGYRLALGDDLSGESDLEVSDLVTFHTSDTLHLIPVAMGSGTVGRIVFGAALIGAGFLTGGLTTFLGKAFIGIGASLLLGGVAQLLSPKPDSPDLGSQQRNTIFGAGSGISSFDYAIPTVYGEVRVKQPAILTNFSYAHAPFTEVNAIRTVAYLTAKVDDTAADAYADFWRDKGIEENEIANALDAETVVTYTPLQYPRLNINGELRNTTIYTVAAAISEGVIEGASLAPAGKSMFLDNTALIASNGAYNFPGNFGYFLTRGTAAQQLGSYLFRNVSVSEQNVGTDLELNSPVVRTITGDLTACIIKLQISQLFDVDNDKGDINNNEMHFLVEMRTDGGKYVPVYDIRYNAKTQTPFEQSFRFNLLQSTSKEWDIRITKTRGDEESEKKPAIASWASISTADPASSPNYPNVAVALMRIDAKYLGGEPELAFDIKGIRILTPHNYNATSRAYSGIFNGNINNRQYSNNPVWVVYDLLTNARYGLGLSPSIIDPYSFYSAAQYCDGNVSDGQGGVEPRFTFNGAIVRRSEAIELIISICATFNAYIIDSDGKVILVVDRPKNAVWAFSPANVVVDVQDDQESPPFEYAQASNASRFSAAEIAYTEPDPDWSEETVEIRDSSLVAQYGFKAKERGVFGCTSRGQATRAARWEIFTSNFNDVFIKFRAARDALPIEVGDVIEVYDPYEQGASLAGRIVSVSGTTVTVDRDVSFVSGSVLYVYLSNGNIGTRNIVSVTDNRNINVDIGGLGGVQEGNVFAIRRGDALPTEWTVLGIEQDDEEVYTIEGVKYDSRKWDYVEKNYLTPERNTSILKAVPETPFNLKVTQSPTLDASNTRIVGRVLVEWQNTQEFEYRIAYYEVQYKSFEYQPEYTTIRLAESPSFTFLGEFDTYDFQVRSVTAVGVKSAWASIRFTIDFDQGVPDDVTLFALDARQDNMAVLSWNRPTNPDVALLGKLRVKFSPTGSGWRTAQELAEFTASTTTGTVALLEGTYYAKWVDPYGNESQNAITAVTTNLNILDKNLIATIDEAPDWLGVKDNVFKPWGENFITLPPTLLWDDADGLFDDRDGLFDEQGLDELNTLGYYYFADELEVSTIQDVEIISDLNYFTFNQDDILWDDAPELWDNRAGLFDGDSVGNASASLEIRTSTDGVTYSDWQPFGVGLFNMLKAQFRIKLTSDGFQEIRITKASITADVKDRLEQGSVTTNAGSDTIVTFSRPYVVAPPNGISYTVQSGTIEDEVEISNITESGFTINIYQSGTRVSRNIYWLTESY